jgi:hypothetical protein
MTSLRPAGTRTSLASRGDLGLIVRRGESGPNGAGHGKVTYENKPLTKGMSHPTQRLEPPERERQITPDGTYTLNTRTRKWGARRLRGDDRDHDPEEYNTKLPGTLFMRSSPLIPKKYGDPKTSASRRPSRADEHDQLDFK